MDYADVRQTVSLKNGRVVRLARYRPEDKEALISMYASTSPEAVKWSLPPYDRAGIQRWTSDLTNNVTLLARSDGRVVGDFTNVQNTYERRKVVVELFIYRHQDFQNAGLGTMLMRKAIELAKKAGLHRIGLSVVADNHRTIKVYQKGRLQEGRNHERVFYGNDHRYHVEVEMGRLLQ